MIGKLRGLVDSTTEDSLILDVNGVGYLVFASSRTLGAVGAAQGEVSLVIETHVREDHIHLYGFLQEAEREWFRLLTSVQGVGAKVALAILSAFGADELTSIVSAQDKTMLTRASGVGKKLAERIVMELKGKVGSLPVGALQGLEQSTVRSASAPISASSGVREEAISALVHLGYQKLDAFTAVARVQHEHPEATLEELIRLGLKELM